MRRESDLRGIAEKFVIVLGESDEPLTTREALLAVATRWGLLISECKYGLTYAISTHQVERDWGTWKLHLPIGGDETVTDEELLGLVADALTDDVPVEDYGTVTRRVLFNAGLTRAAEIAREQAQEHAMVIASGATVPNAHLLDVAAAIDAERCQS